MCLAVPFTNFVFDVHLRTFTLFVSGHPYCARKSTCHGMPRHASSARSTAVIAKMNNDGADGHCYSFEWI